MAISTEQQAPAARTAPFETYQQRCSTFGAGRDREAALSSRISNIRLLVFALAALSAIFYVSGGGDLYLLGAALGLIVFITIAVYHERVVARERRLNGLFTINDEAQKRLARRWKELPARPYTAPPADHAYANDIDVFGPASLFQLIDRTSTSFGSSALQRWLLEEAPPETILSRQAAVAELAPLIDLRDEISLRGRLLGDKTPDPEPFLTWAEGESWLLKTPWLIWAGRLLPLLTIAAILASVTSLSPYPIWLAFLTINLAVLSLAGVRVERTLANVLTMARAFKFYTELFQIVGETRFTAPELLRLQAQLSANGREAYQQMGRLARIAGVAIPPGSALYLPIQLTTFWNLNTLFFLERWQESNGLRVRGWLSALGEFEALASIASLAHMHPEWAFPKLQSSGSPLLKGTTLGHPLITPASRVDNDVEVGPSGTFLLVTGSNMSGKSTLLRSLGTNIVLAQCGSVVCAREMSLPALQLYTSIRIQDSLEQGVSLFMAELLRLKQVVDASREAARYGQRTLFYLLDEILHGTNTAERQIAARRIIHHLVEEGSIGAVSSHDLQLADTPQLQAARRDVHFSETFANGPEGPSMSFDYKLKPGPATSTNALRLMQIVGLDLD